MKSSRSIDASFEIKKSIFSATPLFIFLVFLFSANFSSELNKFIPLLYNLFVGVMAFVFIKQNLVSFFKNELNSYTSALFGFFVYLFADLCLGTISRIKPYIVHFTNSSIDNHLFLSVLFGSGLYIVTYVISCLVATIFFFTILKTQLSKTTS